MTVANMGEGEGTLDFVVNSDQSIYTTFHRFTNIIYAQGTLYIDEFRGNFHTFVEEQVLVND